MNRVKYMFSKLCKVGNDEYNSYYVDRDNVFFILVDISDIYCGVDLNKENKYFNCLIGSDNYFIWFFE